MKFFHSFLRSVAINVHENGLTPVPTAPYIFSRKQAEKISAIVLRGALHQSAGDEVARLEKEFAQYHGVRSAYAVASGTHAIEVALRTIPIELGDEVILPAYTLISTAHAVVRCGGIPVFADIDDSFTISPTSVQTLITKRTKAIIPVHIFGNVADMAAIMRIAAKHKLMVIEDCCQAIGAEYDGKKVGTLGDFGCYSFSAGKAVFAGEGGMIVSANDQMEKRLSYIDGELDALHAGMGTVRTAVSLFRLTELQAALARYVLAELDGLNYRRRHNYHYLLSIMDRSLPITPYSVRPNARPSFSRFVVMIDFKRFGVNRETFVKRMNALKIPMKTFYPHPLYSFSLFSQRYDDIVGSGFPFSHRTDIAYRGKRLPFVERFCKQQVGFPLSPYLQEHHMRYMSSHMHKFFAGSL